MACGVVVRDLPRPRGLARPLPVQQAAAWLPDWRRGRLVAPNGTARGGILAVEAAGIPYTYVCSNFFARYFLPSLAQLGGLTSPPRDKVLIQGDGNVKGEH